MADTTGVFMIAEIAGDARAEGELIVAFKWSGEGPGDAAVAAFSNGGWAGSLTPAVQARELGDLDGAMCGNMLGIFSRKSCRARCGH